MFLEKTRAADKRWQKILSFRSRRWMPLLIVPVAACLAAPDTNSQNILSMQQAFTGRDVPSSHASSPNGQYTWTPAVGGIPQKHIAVSPDGAFYLHAAGKGNTQLYVSALSMTDDMVSGNSVDFSSLGAAGATALNESLDLTPAADFTLGGLGAVAFDPRHGVGPFLIDDTADCAPSAGSVAQVSVPNGSIDCYRMVVYAQVRDASRSPPKYHIAIAPLHIAIEKNLNSQLTTISSATFDAPFERITLSDGATYLDARSNNKDEFSDHFTATADGRLIVFDSKPYYS
jgi:hypothetical protein